MSNEQLFRIFGIVLTLLVLGYWLGYLAAFWFWFVRPLPNPTFMRFKKLFKIGALILAGIILAAVLIWRIHLAQPEIFRVALWPHNTTLLLTIFMNFLFVILFCRACGDKLTVLARFGMVLIAGLSALFTHWEVLSELQGDPSNALTTKSLLMNMALYSICFLFYQVRRRMDPALELPGETVRRRLETAAFALAVGWILIVLGIPSNLD